MADTARLSALRQLSANLPVANRRIAAGLQASRDLQLQRAVGSAPAAGNIPVSAAQLGGVQAAQAGQAQLAQTEQQVGQQQQVAQLGAQEQQRAGQQGIFEQQQATREQQMDNVQRLASLSEGAKKEIYDSRLQFAKDQMGRAYFNERQLADYARTSARSDQDFQNYAQQSEQLHQKKQSLMQSAYNKLAQTLSNEAELRELGLNQQQVLELQRLQKDAQIAQQKAAAKANNTRSMWAAGGAIVGGVAGAVFGGPAGAAIGMQAGSALGGYAGGEQAGSQYSRDLGKIEQGQ